LGKQYVQATIESPLDFIQIASKGINANVIKNFRVYFNISRDSAAHMLNISTPTLYRWIKGNKSLERNYALLLFELADLFLYGAEVFSDNEIFLKWLSLPNTALGGMEPGELIKISGGISKVKDLLGRMEHGVYS
jgi:putative toxin-antitoxin system antitoxin component (TIGR02293 family)